MSNHDLIPHEEVPVVRERRRVLPFFNFLLIVGLGCGGAYAGWLLQKDMVVDADLRDLTNRVTALQNELGELSAQQVVGESEWMTDLTSEFGELTEINTNSIERQREELQEFAIKIKELETYVAREVESSSNSKIVRIADANNDRVTFLLRLARNQLNIWNDPKSALRTLNEVDNLLVELDNAVFDNTRSEILAHIQRVSELASADTTGVLLKLNMLTDKVEEIPFKDARSLTDVPPQETDTSTESASEGSSIWQSLVDSAVGLVKVTSHEQLEVKPLLLPEEQRLIRLRLVLNLEKAAQAVLKSSQSLYDSSLDTVINLTSTYSKTSDAVVVAFVTQLVELKEVRVAEDLPNLDRTIQRFRLAVQRDSMTPETKPEIQSTEQEQGEESN